MIQLVSRRICNWRDNNVINSRVTAFKDIPNCQVSKLRYGGYTGVSIFGC